MPFFVHTSPPGSCIFCRLVSQEIPAATFDPPGLSLLQANGKEGEQTVFHFHMHVVPRHAGDGIALTWPRKSPPREILQAHADRLIQALIR